MRNDVGIWCGNHIDKFFRGIISKCGILEVVEVLNGIWYILKCASPTFVEKVNEYINELTIDRLP